MSAAALLRRLDAEAEAKGWLRAGPLVYIPRPLLPLLAGLVEVVGAWAETPSKPPNTVVSALVKAYRALEAAAAKEGV